MTLLAIDRIIVFAFIGLFLFLSILMTIYYVSFPNVPDFVRKQCESLFRFQGVGPDKYKESAYIQGPFFVLAGVVFLILALFGVGMG